MSSKEYTRDFVIQEFKQMYKNLGNRVPKKKEFIDRSKSKYRYLTLFDKSYNNLVRAAGFSVNRESPNSSTPDDIKRKKIIEDLRQVYMENPNATLTDIIKFSGHGASVISKYVGKTKDVAVAIGYHFKKDGEKIILPYRDTTKKSKEDILQELLTAAANHPEVSTVTKLIEDYCTASVSTFYRYFGGIEQSLKTIVEEARNKNSQSLIMAKRYPVKYKAAPIILKWNRKRDMANV